MRFPLFTSYVCCLGCGLTEVSSVLHGSTELITSGNATEALKSSLLGHLLNLGRLSALAGSRGTQEDGMAGNDGWLSVGHRRGAEKDSNLQWLVDSAPRDAQVWKTLQGSMDAWDHPKPTLCVEEDGSVDMEGLLGEPGCWG